MDTPAKRVSLSPERTVKSHGKNKKKRTYTKNNPPTIAKRSCNLRGQDITEEDTKAMASTPPGQNCREINNLASYSDADGRQGR